MIEELKALGLEHYEAKVLSILFKERLNLRELSKKSGVPFGKVYSIVKSLKEKNIVRENNSRPKLVYVENASEVIAKLLREKNEREKGLNEKLREFASSIDKAKGKETRFFEIGISKDERKKIQIRVFSEAEKEVLQILNIHHNPKVNRLSKSDYESEIERAINRGVKFRAIYPQGVELPRILRSLEKQGKFGVRRINTDFQRCDIVDERKVLIKISNKDVVNSGGSIFVENEKLAENLKKIFEELWNEAE